MIRRLCRPLLAALASACLVGAPARAAPLPEAPPAPAAAEPADLAYNEIEAMRLVFEAMRDQDMAQSEATLRRALALVPEPGAVRGQIACTLASRLYEATIASPGVDQKVLTAVDECIRLLPDDPNAQFMTGTVRVLAGQARRGGLMLIAAVRAKPQVMDSQEIAGTKRILRQLGYGGEPALQAELRRALVEAGYGKDDPDFYGEMAVETMADSVARHANSDALALLPQIVDPKFGLILLMDRRFEPIWPMVEQWAGGTLIKQRDAKLATARAQFKLDSALSNRRILGDALWDAGFQAEALALFGQAVGDPATWDEDRFYISLLTGRYAKMLVFQGRVPEAVAVATRVKQANPGDKYPYALNLMPNFAYALIQAGRDQEALDLLQRETPRAGQLEDPMAFGFYTALRFCAYYRLGQTREAAAQRVLLDTRYAMNGPARTIRNACSADARTARSLWAARMSEPATRGEVILAFYRARLGIRTLGMLDELGADTVLRGDEALHAAFAGFARELPDSYLPALRDWETPPAPPKP